MGDGATLRRQYSRPSSTLQKCPTDAFWPTVHFSTNAVLLAECDKRVACEFSIRRLHADARGPPRDFPNSLLEPLPAPHRRNVLRKLLSGPSRPAKRFTSRS